MAGGGTQFAGVDHRVPQRLGATLSDEVGQVGLQADGQLLLLLGIEVAEVFADASHEGTDLRRRKDGGSLTRVLGHATASSASIRDVMVALNVRQSPA